MIRARMPFLDKIAASMRARDSILCIGLDPEPALIPDSLGRGPQAAVRFLRRIVKATSDYACCYKPNLAFYERYGSAAFDVLGLVLQAIPDVAPDLALVDVAMPGLDGRELSRRIRDQYRGLFPIVMHSARTTDADRWSSFRHGADYYLPKPCEPHQLLDVVDYYSDFLDAEERQFLETRM